MLHKTIIKLIMIMANRVVQYVHDCRRLNLTIIIIPAEVRCTYWVAAR